VPVGTLKSVDAPTGVSIDESPVMKGFLNFILTSKNEFDEHPPTGGTLTNKEAANKANVNVRERILKTTIYEHKELQ
jgi:hypothetical protein